jgi:hypothetical protein
MMHALTKILSEFWQQCWPPRPNGQLSIDHRLHIMNEADGRVPLLDSSIVSALTVTGEEGENTDWDHNNVLIVYVI